MKQCIGVIGAGIMGKGVAQHFAKYGYEVILLDKNPDVLEKAEGEILRDLKMKSMFDKALNVQEIMGNISLSKEYSSILSFSKLYTVTSSLSGSATQYSLTPAVRYLNSFL